MRTLTCAHFAKHLDEAFALHAEAETLELRLISAEAISSSSVDGAEREPFALIFRGAKQPILPQSTYRMDHPEMGSLHIFVVPIEPDQEGQCYEAVFT